MPKSINFIDLTLRDGQQSLAATRMTTQQALSVLKMIDNAGYQAIELWGGATLDTCIRFLNEDPWDRLEQFRAMLGSREKIRILLRGQNLFAYQPFPDDLVIAFTKQAIQSGVGIVRIFDALNDLRNLQIALLATKAYGGKAEAAISYTISPVHTTDYFVDLALKLQNEGADQIAIKDMAGLLYPTTAVELFHKLRQKLTIPITFHSHTTTGVATLNAVIAMHEGIDNIDTAITPFAGGTSHPPIEVLIVFAEALGLRHGLNKRLILKIQAKLFDIFQALQDVIPTHQNHRRPVHFKDINKKMVQSIIKRINKGGAEHIQQALNLMRKLMQNLGYPKSDSQIFESQIPGGMLSNLENQLRQMGKSELLGQIMEEIPAVRADVGYVPLVTPTSQIVGSQATFNVMMGRYQFVSNEFRMLLNGEFGQLPTQPNPEVQARVLGNGQAPQHYRPASYLSPVLEDKYNLPFVKTHKDLLLHLMLKQPADEFLKRKYGVT
jgi:pyruvate/oxaloacetate carboxyltransferase